MTGPKNALAAWGASALHAVELPSGMRALVKLPNVRELLEADAFPQELRTLASKYASTGISIESLDDEGLRGFVRLTYELVARSVKYLAQPAEPDAKLPWEDFKSNGAPPIAEGWELVSISAEQLRQMDVDQSDLDALGAIAGRMKTPNEVTAYSRMDRALLVEGAGVVAALKEGGESVSGFASFRGQPDGADAGADSEDVRLPAVGGARDRGSGGRVRGRRVARS